MKIKMCFTKEETAEMLRHVTLRGNPSAFPYKNAEIILGKVTLSKLRPCQYYVYKAALRRTNEVSGKLYMREIFEKRDVGCVEMETEDGDRFIHMPPIVEQVENGKGLLIVADGTHRVFNVILDSDKDVYCWIINGVDPQYPYYANPIKGSWANVGVYDALPDNFIKRDYRENYKELYRDFNAVFNGIQPSNRC